MSFKASFGEDLRHAMALPAVGGFGTTPFLRRTQALYLLRWLPHCLGPAKKELQRLRPKKTQLLRGELRIFDYEHNLAVWEILNDALLVHLNEAVTHLFDASKDVQDDVSRHLAAAAKAVQRALRSLRLPVARQLLVEERSSRRDRVATAWRADFQRLAEDLWRPLLADLAGRRRAGAEGVVGAGAPSALAAELRLAEAPESSLEIMDEAAFADFGAAGDVFLMDSFEETHARLEAAAASWRSANWRLERGIWTRIVC